MKLVTISVLVLMVSLQEYQVQAVNPRWRLARRTNVRAALANKLDPNFWPTRGRRSDVQFMKASPQQRQTTDEEGPFWANRGRSISELGTMLAIPSLQKNFYTDQDKEINAEGTKLFSFGQNDVNGPLWANRGHTAKENGVFWLDESRSVPVDGDGPFWANRGRSTDTEGPFWANRGRSTENEGPFWANRGRSTENEGPFWANRGRSVTSSEDETGSMVDLFKPKDDVHHVRAESGEEVPFWANRGRSAKLNEEGPFWANRGRFADPEGLNRDILYADEPGWVALPRHGGRRSVAADQAEDTFWVARGKRDNRSKRGAFHDEAMWRERRGNKTDRALASLKDAQFWPSRGKKLPNHHDQVKKSKE